MRLKKVAKIKKLVMYRVAFAVRDDGHVLTSTRNFETKEAAERFVRNLNRNIIYKRTKIGKRLSFKVQTSSANMQSGKRLKKLNL